MKRFVLPLCLSVALSVFPGVSLGEAGSRTQLLAQVGPQLPIYVQGVDPSALSTQQLARLHMVMFGFGSDNQKRALVRSIVRGRHSLRGVFGTARIGVSR